MCRVLVISNRILSQTDNNGKTLLNLIKDIPDENVSQLYFYGSLPEVKGYRYFQISSKDILKGKINKKLRGREVFPADNEYIPVGNNETINRKYGIKRTPINLILRELLWKNSWHSNQLEDWLNKISPDVIFFMAGDALYAYEICEWIRRNHNCKLYSYVTDDYILKRTKETFVEKKRRKAIYKSLMRCARNSTIFFTICERMRIVYRKKLGVDSQILFNRCISLYDEKLSKQSEHNKEIVFMYAGSLYYGRDSVLIELAKVLNRINSINMKKAVLNVYTNSKPDEKFVSDLEKTGAGNYKGSLNADELKSELNLCNFPVFVESIEKHQVEKVQLSFSTKIPEYLSLKKTILAIGPSDIGSMDYLEKYAVCVNDLTELYNTCLDILNNKKMLIEYPSKAYEGYKKLMELKSLREYIIHE